MNAHGIPMFNQKQMTQAHQQNQNFVQTANSSYDMTGQININVPANGLCSGPSNNPMSQNSAANKKPSGGHFGGKLKSMTLVNKTPHEDQMPHIEPQRQSILAQEHNANYQTFLNAPNTVVAMDVDQYHRTSDSLNMSEFGVDIAQLQPRESDSPS